MKLRLKDYDFTLLVAPVLLAAFGVVMVYSASMVTTVFMGLESTYFFKRQIIWFVIGMLGYIICLIFPYKTYKKIIVPLMVFAFISLIAVLFVGHSANNATRALKIASFSFQPAEFFKIIIIIYLATVYSNKLPYITNLQKGVLPPLLLSMIYLYFIYKQPDLGTMSIITLLIAVIILSSGIRMKHAILLLAVGGVFLSLTIPRAITETRIGRITGAYNPFEDPEGVGHQLIESYLAIGGGGLPGEGLGQSIQKLGYLWGAHTDFIMAIIAEELGVFGVMLVIGMFALIVLRGLYIAIKCQDPFGSLLAIGISSLIAIQAGVNLAAISGLLPITGVPLPFISYGGSSLIVSLAAMGILNNIAKEVNVKTQVINEENYMFNSRSNEQIKYGSDRKWST